MENKICSGGKRYCVLCSNSQGQVLEDGTKISLHCLPGGSSKEETKRRSIWIQRIKLVRPNAPISSNTRLCNLHFEGNTCTKSSVPIHMDLSKAKKEISSRRPLFRKNLDENNNENSDKSSNDNFDLSTIIQSIPSKTQDVSTQSYVVNTDISTQTTCSSTNTCEQEERGTQTHLPKLVPEDLENNDDKTRYYTGFPNFATFSLIFNLLLQHGADKLTYWEGQKRTTEIEDRRYINEFISKPGRKRKLRAIDEFYLVCLRLRLGLLQEILADLFGISVMSVSRTLNTWINFMYDHMKGLIPWPSREQILANLPSSFVDMPDVRIVIDATEFFCEKPSSLTAQYLTWSEYKNHNTFKVLIGVAPNGLVTFISRVWGGRASDRHIVQKDGNLFLPLLESGDIILADKGFTIGDLLPGHIGLNMPPFIASNAQMTQKEFFKTQQIAAPRIVVEMKMEQIKNFKILQNVLPLTEAHLVEQMIVICTAITNLYPPLLK